jgi:hypothetical protein
LPDFGIALIARPTLILSIPKYDIIIELITAVNVAAVRNTIGESTAERFVDVWHFVFWGAQPFTDNFSVTQQANKKSATAG